MIQKAFMMNSVENLILFEVTKVLTEIRGSFDWDTFRDMKSMSKRLAYAEENLPEYLGSGSSRTAYVLSNRYVLKIARNNKGVAQNEAEVELAVNPHINKITTKIYDVGTKYSYLVTDIVRPLGKDDKAFENIIGTNWTNFYDILQTYYRFKSLDAVAVEIEDQIEQIDGEIEYFTRKLKEVEKSPELQRGRGLFVAKKLVKIQYKRKEELLALMDATTLPFIEDVLKALESTDLLIGDLLHSEHWGKTADGRIVLLDYGLTRDVHSKHYR